MIMCALGWIEKCVSFVAIFKNGYIQPDSCQTRKTQVSSKLLVQVQDLKDGL